MSQTDLTTNDVSTPKAVPIPSVPARVGLTSFVIYKVVRGIDAPNSRIDVFTGGEAGRFTPEGKLQLLAANVPFRSESFKRFAPKHGHGMLSLYGHRDALEELSFWRAKARELGAEFAYVNYDIEVGAISGILLDRAMLLANSSVHFLNMRRARTTLQHEIRDRFKGYVKSEADTNTIMTEVAHIAKRPDLFDRLFQDDKDLQQLSVLVIPVADDLEVPGRMRQLAYMRPGLKVLNVVQGSDQVEVLMPSWLIDEKLAEQFRAAV